MVKTLHRTSKYRWNKLFSTHMLLLIDQNCYTSERVFFCLPVNVCLWFVYSGCQIIFLLEPPEVICISHLGPKRNSLRHQTPEDRRAAAWLALWARKSCFITCPLIYVCYKTVFVFRKCITCSCKYGLLFIFQPCTEHSFTLGLKNKSYIAETIYLTRLKQTQKDPPNTERMR